MSDASAVPTVEILGSRPWKRALFTTYALSLSFFETAVLPALRSAGAVELDEIWVIADVSGYRGSLMERHSRGVGQDYRLVPAALPNGVFHPKCTYLSGDDGDLLLVGSGNLTFGGYGRNLEVLEVLDPQSSPGAFLDFADFLGAIEARRDLRIPQGGWTGTFAGLARSAAAGSAAGTREDEPRLVHSLLRPIAVQLGERAAELAPIKRLTVLSPFHDPDGKAVVELARRVGSPAVRIGLPANKGELSSFPFGKKPPKGERWSAARPQTTHVTRKLHAKWFEIEGQRGSLTITGSVNATSKALSGTDNVEVGVVRRSKARPDWVEWEAAALPESHRDQLFRTGGLGQGAVVYATLFADGVLEGTILANGAVQGQWKAVITPGRGTRLTTAAAVSESGNFRFRVARAEAIARAPAVQITLSRGAVEARGWVQNDEILRMTRIPGLAVSTVLRLGSEDESESDAIALLGELAMNGASHFRSFIPSTIQTAGAAVVSPKSDPKPTVVRLSELAPNAEVFEEDDPHHLGAGTSPEMLLHMALLNLRRRLVGSVDDPELAALGGPVAAGPDDGDETGDDDEAAGAHVRRRLPEALQEFDERMREFIADPAMDDLARRGLLSMWLEVKLHMLLRRECDHDGAVTFMVEWLATATRAALASASPAALEEHVCAVTSLVAGLDPDGRDGLRMSRLHEGLERFWGGTVDVESAHQLVSERTPATIRHIAANRDVGLLAALDDVLARKTLRQELVELLQLHRAGAALPEQSPAFQGEAGAALLRSLRLPPAKARIREQLDERPICPYCFAMLSDSAAQSLRLHRVARCSMNCGCLVVRTTP